MKKLKHTALAGFIFLSSFSIVKAQDMVGISTSSLKSFVTATSDVAMPLKIETRAVTRAHNDFIQRFKEGPNTTWLTEDFAISATFKKDDVTYKIVYDKKGHWIRNMKSYDENKMQSDVRESIKRSDFYDCKILFVREIEESDKLFYLVYLEDKNSYKQVVYFNGEAGLYKNIIKNY